jgi:hypothetical protein
LRELWLFVLAVVKRAALVLTGTVITLGLVLWPHVASRIWTNAPLEIPDRPFLALAAACFLWAIFLAWRDEHRKAAPSPTDTMDIRIEDNARQLRRQLAAGLERWPENDPHALDDLVIWARKLAQGFPVTGRGVRELERLRAEASARVKLAVRTVAEHYDAVADIVNPVLKQNWKLTDDMYPMQSTNLANPELEPATTAALRKAVAEMRQCLKALDALTKS